MDTQVLEEKRRSTKVGLPTFLGDVKCNNGITFYTNKVFSNVLILFLNNSITLTKQAESLKKNEI